MLQAIWVAIIFNGLGHQDGWQASMPDITQSLETGALF